MAYSIGFSYTSPEAEWNRFDDPNTAFSYENMTATGNGDTLSFYNGYYHCVVDQSKPHRVRFNFVGTKFRLFTQCYTDGRNQNFNVYVDGKFIHTASAPNQLINGRALYYELPAQSNGEHSVVLEHLPSSQVLGYIIFDTIDIDQSGTVKTYNPINMSLLTDGTNLYSFDLNTLTLKTSGAYPQDVTQTAFQTKGIEYLGLIPVPVFSSIANLTILTFTTSGTQKTMKTVQAPTAKFVTSGDIPIGSIQAINQVSIANNTSGSGIVKMVVSIDSGTTWCTWDSASNGWKTVDTSNVNNVLDSGMDKTMMQARTKTDWINLIGTIPRTIRFGYALDIRASSNIANVDSISMSVDMRGRWRQTAPVAEQNVFYPGTSLIQVEIYASGDYKINY